MPCTLQKMPTFPIHFMVSVLTNRNLIKMNIELRQELVCFYGFQSESFASKFSLDVRLFFFKLVLPVLVLISSAKSYPWTVNGLNSNKKNWDFLKPTRLFTWHFFYRENETLEPFYAAKSDTFYSVENTLTLINIRVPSPHPSPLTLSPPPKPKNHSWKTHTVHA